MIIDLNAFEHEKLLKSGLVKTFLFAVITLILFILFITFLFVRIVQFKCFICPRKFYASHKKVVVYLVVFVHCNLMLFLYHYILYARLFVSQ